MRIALITSMKFGLHKFVYRDIAALYEKGHEVIIFTLHNRKGLYNPRPEWETVPIRLRDILWAQLWLIFRKPILYTRLIRSAWRTKSLINLILSAGFIGRMKNIDIIYAYFGDHKLFTGYYCKRILGIPLAVTIRAYELYRNPNQKLFCAALDHCDRIITITDYNRNLLTQKYGVDPGRIDLIRQIIDLEAYRYKEKIKILIVGFFAEKKGHEILFKAIKRMRRDDIELWVVGDINPSVVPVDCRGLADQLGIAHRVAFFGMLSGNALRALYRECDIFCLPSRPDRYGDKEGFPNVIAEAMAFGKPVVSTLHAGIPEVVDSILVKENDDRALAQALNRACESAQLRDRLGRANRGVVERLFSHRNNDKLEHILLQCANHRSDTISLTSGVPE